MDTMNHMIGNTGIAAGEKSALRAFVPSTRLRARQGAGMALVDFAPDSVSWRHPVC